ncbi:hypothetical protein ASE14_11920 [Agromyces sp. Root81]|uniref:hypothetical protein n=1 Tax=Agromyces sp. Root81 TaxID=1736601 RepID=UPI0006FDAECD|nr:hypothetical protein [Agromyces sp. Root81]KRC61548.1 hypothetical protein ASE14_11920 [Agromyces sp. Root81]
MNITTMPTDWKNNAVPTLRAVLAEAVTAEIAEALSEEGSARWFGEQNPGFDVISVAERFNPDESPDADLYIKETVRRNAKSIRLMSNDRGDWAILAQRDAKRFNPAKVDVLTLVHMGETETAFAIDLDTGTASGVATSQILDVWEVPVGRMNELLDDIAENNPDKTLRNCELDLDHIEEFRVFGRIRDFYPAWLEEARDELASCEESYTGCLEDVAALKDSNIPAAEASQKYKALEESATRLITALLAVHVGRRVEGFNLSFDGGASLAIAYDRSSANGVWYSLEDLVEREVASGGLSRRLNDILGSFGLDPDLPGAMHEHDGVYQSAIAFNEVNWPAAPQIEPPSAPAPSPLPSTVSSNGSRPRPPRPNAAV